MNKITSLPRGTALALADAFYLQKPLNFSEDTRKEASLWRSRYGLLIHGVLAGAYPVAGLANGVPPWLIAAVGVCNVVPIISILRATQFKTHRLLQVAGLRGRAG